LSLSSSLNQSREETTRVPKKKNDAVLSIMNAQRRHARRPPWRLKKSVMPSSRPPVRLKKRTMQSSESSTLNAVTQGDPPPGT
jgi:hypothetical protein